MRNSDAMMEIGDDNLEYALIISKMDFKLAINCDKNFGWPIFFEGEFY